MSLQELVETSTVPLIVQTPRKGSAGPNINIKKYTDRDSVSGKIGERTDSKRRYSDVHVMKNVFSLRDPKYRTLSLQIPFIKSSHSGKDNEYTEQYPYIPVIPHSIRRLSRHYNPSRSINDQMNLYDSEHVLGVVDPRKFSHGGIRDLNNPGIVNNEVDNVVPKQGPDSVSLNRHRGLQFQYNYKNKKNIKKVADRNFLKGVTALKSRKYTDARVAPSNVIRRPDVKMGPYIGDKSPGVASRSGKVKEFLKKMSNSGWLVELARLYDMYNRGPIPEQQRLPNNVQRNIEPAPVDVDR